MNPQLEDVNNDGIPDFRDPRSLGANVAALLDIGESGAASREASATVGLIDFFGEDAIRTNDFNDIDSRPELRFTAFDGEGEGLDSVQQELVFDPTQFIHLVVTSQWEVYEYLYGQGENQESIRYANGISASFTEGLDQDKYEELIQIIERLESEGCHSVDSFGSCQIDPFRHLKPESETEPTNEN